jgi:hypothetical protein
MQRHSIVLTALLLAVSAATAQTATSKPEGQAVMQRYIIERDIPGAGKLTLDDHRGGAAKSNRVLREMGPDIQWVHSYVAGDKIYCLYNATSEALVREHAARSGFPANKITPVSMIVDPTTASPAR